jgi:hypothetical protein
MMSLSVEKAGLRVPTFDETKSHSSTQIAGFAFATAALGLLGAYLATQVLKVIQEGAVSQINDETPPSFTMLRIAGMLLGAATPFCIKSIVDDITR